MLPFAQPGLLFLENGGATLWRSTLVRHEEPHRVKHVVYRPERREDEEACEPGHLTRDEFGPEAVNHICLQLHVEVVEEAEEAGDLCGTNDYVNSCESVLHLQYDHVRQQDAIHVNMVAASPESERFAVRNGGVLTGPEAHHQDH